MALIKCPECGKEISDKSKTCVHCGFPLDENRPEPIEPNDSIIEVSASEEPMPAQEEAVSKLVTENPEIEEQKSTSENNTSLMQNRSLKYIIIAVVVVVIGWFAINNLVLLPQKYATAEQLLKNGQYAEAIAAFEELGSYSNAEKDKEYAIALAQYNAEEYEASLEHFEALDDYRDSKAYFESMVYKPVYTELDSGGKKYTIDQSYDDEGRLKYFVESSDKASGVWGDGEIIWQLRRTYEYDSEGNLASMIEQNYGYEELTYTAIYTYTYSFNEDGSVKERQCVLNRDRETSYSTTTYEYNEEGQVVWEHYRSSKSNSNTQYEYDCRGLTSKKTYTKDNGYTEVHNYSYDRYGNLYKDRYTFDNINTEGGLTECVSTYWHKRYEVVVVNDPVF